MISQKFESITLERSEIDLDSRLSVSKAIFFIVLLISQNGNFILNCIYCKFKQFDKIII
jgi:hypothetical protein